MCSPRLGISPDGSRALQEILQGGPEFAGMLSLSTAKSDALIGVLILGDHDPGGRKRSAWPPPTPTGTAFGGRPANWD